jgi:hypothetical protein
MTICRGFRVSVRALAALAMCAALGLTICSAPVLAQQNAAEENAAAQENSAQVRPPKLNYTTLCRTACK